MKSAKYKLLAASALTLVGTLAFADVTAPARSFANTESSEKYASEYASKQEANDAGLALNYQIAAEGAVLLKNENDTLPLKITETEGEGQQSEVLRSGNRISVFGYGSIAPNGGGSVNDAEASAGRVTFNSTFYKSLENSNYAVNPKLKSMYEGYLNDSTVTSDKDIDIGNYSLPSFERSYGEYGDAAVVILGNSSYSDEENNDGAEYLLQYGDSQKALVNFVTSKFNKVVVLINKSVPMEIDWLKKNDRIGAILLVGEAGTNGLDAVGPLLSGEINPSGRLVDTYIVDQKQSPVYVNYNKSGNADVMTGNDTYKRYVVNGETTPTYFVEYEEGIYVGYRYWETRGYEENDGWNWYNNHVSYPFGYGLSYTNFEWEILDSSTPSGSVSADGTIKFDVKVTNTGSVAGKDVVELFYTAPYTSGGIEKSYVELGAFAKTGLIQPEQSETVTLEIKVEDMASYDYNDANENGNCGYELDAGEYQIRLSGNAHDAAEIRSFTLAETVNVKGSHNLFDDSNKYVDNKFSKKLSRADFAATMPDAVTDAEASKLSAEEYEKFRHVIVNDENDEMPTQATESTRPEKAAIKLSDLKGKAYDDPMWESLLNELTVEEMQTMFENGGFHSEAIDYIGKPFSRDTDGPLGWTGTGVAGTPYNRFASEPVIASTWNVCLAEKLGEMIGEQGLWGSSDRTDGAAISAYTGWYAPGMNLHRSAFDYRYTEYYSEDGLLMGKLVANISNGLNKKGGYLFIKHFALHNDGAGVNSYRGLMGEGADETSGMAVWASEQTMRQVYFKAYEIAVKEGGARGAMSAFNRIGYTWAGSNKALLCDLLRDEWGFKGFVVTDIAIYDGLMNGDAMIRAGGDLVLSGFVGNLTDATTKTATGLNALRRATKNVLWVVLNSNAMQPCCGAKVELDRYAGFVREAQEGKAYSSDTAQFGDEATVKLNTVNTYGDISFTADGLPSGLTIDASTGKISGTPTESGVFDITITALADGYASATQEYTLFVNSAAKKGGCGSSLDFGAGLTLAAGALVLGGAAVIIRKRKFD